MRKHRNQTIARLKREYPGWGAPKIREKLRQRSLGVHNQERAHQALGMQVRPTCTRGHRASIAASTTTYPFHDATMTVTHCWRICFKGQKVNLSQVFAVLAR